MKSIENGEIDCVIVRDLSRLGRDYIQTGEHLRKIFPQLGVRFISILDNIDTKKDGDVGGNLDITLKTILNDSYSRDISKKTRSALRVKQQNGDYVGACPVYGYQKAEDNHNQLVVDPETAPIVYEIFSLKKEGYGASKIAEILNKRGVLSPLTYKKSKGLPTPTGGFADVLGCGWSATTILRMLQDSTYIGTLTQGKETTYSYKLKEKKQRPKEEWAVKQNAHQAIIQKEEFDLVQTLLKMDTRTSPHKESLYLFSGLLICASCGCPMVRKTVPHKNKKYVYYACNTGRKNGCTTKMIKEETLTKIVQTAIHKLTNFALDEEEFFALLEEEQSKMKLKSNATEEIKSILVQKQELIRIKGTLYENMLSGLISKEEYRELKKDYDKDIEALTEREREIQEKSRENSLNEDKKPIWMAYLNELRKNPPLDRKLIVSLIHSITIGEKLHISYRFENVFENIQDDGQKSKEVTENG